ncbi:MAG: CopD family protein, partial [Helicobacter japonicus]|nr:CopD family protein [Helicobacter japonicus]
MEFLYIKAFHIIVLVTWMAMLFYLPRLFVYHAQHRDNESFTNIVKLQELR